MIHWVVLLLSSLALCEATNFNWTQSGAPTSQPWRKVTSSADGKYLVASEYGNAGDTGSTWYSLDDGATWAQSSGAPGMSSLVSDKTGQYIAGAGGYVSADFGATFTKVNGNFGQVVSDASGSFLAAVSKDQFQPVYVSSDRGATWSMTSCTSTYGLRYIAADSTGAHLISVTTTGEVYFSQDHGSTWTAAAFTKKYPKLYWNGVVYDGNGNNAYAFVFDPSSGTSMVYASRDHGNNWAPTSAPQSSGYEGLACDSSGAIVVAAEGSDAVYVSTDFGNTWAKSVPKNDYYGVSVNAYGSQIALASTYRGGILIGQITH